MENKKDISNELLAISVNDLTVAYNEKPVLWDVDFKAPQGSLLAIVGPNGAGKSTLVKAILGLIKPAAGQVLVFDNEYRPQSRLIGYVPQKSSVDWDFPTTVLDVVMMGRYGQLGWFKRPTKDDKNLAIECLEKVGMKDFMHRQISQLSGGQQQRVFIARAFIQDAPIYLMDEPFAGVDAATEKSIITLLRELKQKGKTVICVHHDLQTLKEYFEWIMLLNVRRVALGPVDEVLTHENLKKAYGGKAAFLAGIDK
jgi:manganese/zinc/iron transport system ATP- binding protein